MKSVLVTGATGFTGRALSARLIEGPWRLRGAVRNAERADLLPPGMDLAAVGSIGPDTDWREALEGIDTVVHLAAAVPGAGAGANQSNIFDHVNFLGSKRLAETAAESGVRRMVYLSSIEVNGTASQGRPFTETDEPDPRTDYGRSKLKTENELLRIGDTTDLEVVIIRPPFIYGPGNLGYLMSLIKSLVSRGLPMPLASVANHRSFIYIENLLDAIISCCTSNSAAGEIFLVSDGPTVSTPGLVRLIASEMNRKPKLFPFPVSWLRLAGKILGKGTALKLLTDSYHLDCGKIQKVLGWNAPFSMEEGIGATVRASMRND